MTCKTVNCPSIQKIHSIYAIDIDEDHYDISNTFYMVKEMNLHIIDVTSIFVRLLANYQLSQNILYHLFTYK